MTKHKRLGKGRSLTIPKDMAAYLDLKAGDAVELIAADSGDLIIRRHADTCRFCGGAENVGRFGDISVCPVCADRLCREVCG